MVNNSGEFICWEKNIPLTTKESECRKKYINGKKNIQFLTKKVVEWQYNLFPVKYVRYL